MDYRRADLLTHLGQHPAKPSTAGLTPGSASLPSRYSFGASMMPSVAPGSGGGVYIAAGHLEQDPGVLIAELCACLKAPTVREGIRPPAVSTTIARYIRTG